MTKRSISKQNTANDDDGNGRSANANISSIDRADTVINTLDSFPIKNEQETRDVLNVAVRLK